MAGGGKNYIGLHRKNRYYDICWSITRGWPEVQNGVIGVAGYWHVWEGARE